MLISASVNVMIALCGILRVDVVGNNRHRHIAILVDLHILDLQRR
ncbi:hypothetical protein [Mesorhizobium sp.]|nr:hypothetical protein [Mesorhizobium sp.]